MAILMRGPGLALVVLVALLVAGVGPALAQGAPARAWFVDAAVFGNVDRSHGWVPSFVSNPEVSSRFQPGLRLGVGRWLGPRSEVRLEVSHPKREWWSSDEALLARRRAYRADILAAFAAFHPPSTRAARFGFLAGFGAQRNEEFIETRLKTRPVTTASRQTATDASLLFGVEVAWRAGSRFDAIAGARLSLPISSRSGAAVFRPDVGLRWRF
ncbi:MAG: hypothetical protein R2752_17845 [Vicinamibacterales bacterium]